MDDLINRQDAVDKWKNDFKEYINALDIPKDDYKGIMEYIDELPSAQPPALTCDGCRHVGTYDTDFPCSVCIRREKDYYVQER